MIVEDSDVVRQLLSHIVEADPRLHVVGAVATAEEALRLLERLSPDVISLDIRLPGMNGFEATRRIMSERPTPIVVVSASVESEELPITMNALRAGALTVLEKPSGGDPVELKRMATALCDQLVVMSEVKVVRQRSPRRSVIPEGSRPCGSRSSRTPAATTYRMVGVVASTGGPRALAQLLEGLGGDLPVPILIVQHITSGFLDGFVRWLDGLGHLRASIVQEGERPQPGRVYVAPHGGHLEVEKDRLLVRRGERVSGQIPSGTVLLQSMARELGPAALGVVLTGMGADGAQGLLDLRQAGGYTIAEAKSTAIVYGMPAAAAELGAACEMLPLTAISGRLRELVRMEARVF